MNALKRPKVAAVNNWSKQVLHTSRFNRWSLIIMSQWMYQKDQKSRLLMTDPGRSYTLPVLITEVYNKTNAQVVTIVRTITSKSNITQALSAFKFTLRLGSPENNNHTLQWGPVLSTVTNEFSVSISFSWTWSEPRQKWLLTPMYGMHHNCVAAWPTSLLFSTHVCVCVRGVGGCCLRMFLPSLSLLPIH